MSDHAKLKVLGKSKKVAVDCRKAAQRIRGIENISFRTQIIRAAFSVPSNIIEGNGVQSAKEYSRYVRTAINSSNELEFHIETAGELELMPQKIAADLLPRIEEVRKMLSGLLRYLEMKAKEEDERKKRKRSEI
jgi:four helix bundle protein